ncbi:hypothetical protein V6N13_127263 [Hibiscus sabdariffa]
MIQCTSQISLAVEAYVNPTTSINCQKETDDRYFRHMKLVDVAVQENKRLFSVPMFSFVGLLMLHLLGRVFFLYQVV